MLEWLASPLEGLRRPLTQYLLAGTTRALTIALLNINHHLYIVGSATLGFSHLGSELSILYFKRGLISAMAKLNCRLSHGVWAKKTLISLEEFFWIPTPVPHLVDMNAKLIL